MRLIIDDTVQGSKRRGRESGRRVKYEASALTFLRAGVCASVYKFENIGNKVGIQLRNTNIKGRKQHRELEREMTYIISPKQVSSPWQHAPRIVFMSSLQN